MTSQRTTTIQAAAQGDADGPDMTLALFYLSQGRTADVEGLEDTDLLVLWDRATEQAEDTDRWDAVATLEAEVNARGLV